LRNYVSYYNDSTFKNQGINICKSINNRFLTAHFQKDQSYFPSSYIEIDHKNDGMAVPLLSLRKYC
jgi:hypothetical protein